MNKYLRLFRLGNGLMGIIGVLTGALIAAGLDIANSWMSVAIASFVAVWFIAGGNALNDYIDRDIDLTSHPERPIPSGEMTAKEALYAGVFAFVLAIAASFLLWDAVSIMIVLIACSLMLSYELFLKQRGFVGNVTIAVLTGMLFLLGGAVVNNIESVIAVACMAILVSIGREIAKDIEDMEGDEGRNTLPMRIGVRNACMVAAISLMIGTALSIHPWVMGMFGPLYYLIIVPCAIFIYSSFVIFHNPHRAQKLCKYAMLIALAAFILGAVYQ